MTWFNHEVLPSFLRESIRLRGPRALPTTGASALDAAEAQRRTAWSFWVVTTLAALVGLALRVAYVLVAPPISRLSDARGYYYIGKYLAEGRGYVNWGSMLFRGVQAPSAAYAPLFSFLLSLLHRLGITAMADQRLVICALGVASVPLIALLGRAVGGKSTGQIAAVLAALSPTLIEFDGALMTESLYISLMTLAFLFIVVAWKRPTLPGWTLAGGLLGLAALTRPEGLLFLPFLALPLAWTCQRRRRILLVLAASLGLVVVVLPWTIRNAVVFKRFIPISQNFKGAIVGANCKVAY